MENLLYQYCSGKISPREKRFWNFKGRDLNNRTTRCNVYTNSYGSPHNVYTNSYGSPHNQSYINSLGHYIKSQVLPSLKICILLTVSLFQFLICLVWDRQFWQKVYTMNWMRNQSVYKTIFSFFQMSLSLVKYYWNFLVIGYLVLYFAWIFKKYS